MKEKPKPILLVTAIVVLMGVIMVINATGMFGDNKPESVDAPPEQIDAAQSASNLSRTEAIDRLKDAANIGIDGVIEDEAVPVVLLVPENPTIEVPRPTVFKQTPDENSIAGQWWDDDSLSKEISEDNERKRGGQ